MDNNLVKFIHDFAKKYRAEEYKKGLKGGIRDMALYAGGQIYAIIIHEILKRAGEAGEGRPAAGGRRRDRDGTEGGVDTNVACR